MRGVFGGTAVSRGSLENANGDAPGGVAEWEWKARVPAGLATGQFLVTQFLQSWKIFNLNSYASGHRGTN